MPKLYGYARASTSEQMITLTVQQDTIRREYDHGYATAYEWGGVFTDQGVSGSKELRNRPEGFKLAHALEKGDCIIFTKLDRGFRNVVDLVETLKSWQARGVRVILLDMRVDTGTPIGMMIVTIFAAVAEFELARMRERRLDSNAERRRQGLAINQNRYGFKVAGPKGRRYFVPDPKARAIGAKILEWREAGWTYEAIYLHLFKNKILNPFGREWSEGGIVRTIGYEKRLQLKEKAKREQAELDKQAAKADSLEVLPQQTP
jgi:DNA invertase Pin-like site-specific DNA recombinase